MYSTCLFCHSSLGANDVIESFPVGRRLAFDAAKGRLWVICRKCERWNLTPIEERWEATETCERLFRDTTLRVSTDNIGLARVREGLELVRIGSPKRPEMAAWRYGDQFGQRRRRAVALTTAGGIGAAGIVVLGPLAGLGLFSGFNLVVNAYNVRNFLTRTRITLPGHADLVNLRGQQLLNASIHPAEEGWRLRLVYRPHKKKDRYGFRVLREEVSLAGDDAMRVARQLLPKINSGGAGKSVVARAVQRLEELPNPHALFTETAQNPGDWGGAFNYKVPMKWKAKYGIPLSGLPKETRLALEMASHEDVERRALEGELALLEAAWKEAEEIAAIADSMFLPSAISDRLDVLKRGESPPQ